MCFRDSKRQAQHKDNDVLINYDEYFEEESISDLENTINRMGVT